jgi:16S rRNA (cytosine967-C5)-methyltransferase
MKIEHQVRAFEQLFHAYDGSTPLNRFLPAYFKQNKQMGSSDRRWATRYIYSYFRLGKALIKVDLIQRLAIADFLCNGESSLLTETHLPYLFEKHDLPLPQKLALVKELHSDFELSEVFAFPSYLSDEIDRTAFYTSFFIQPDLFIRVRENDMQSLISALERAEVQVRKIGDNTLALPNGTKLEQLLPDYLHYQVQDLSSQKTGTLFNPQMYDYWWDCCAASGGKSLLLHDLQPKIELLVSDLRENSLHNLDERFRNAGLRKYQKKVLDLLQNNEQELHHYEFDGIILDAPCSGSGTWGRTPELLHHFEAHRIDFFSKLQKSIAANVVPYLKPGKPLIYITCSVFKSENEEVVQHLLETQPLKLEKMEVIKGYEGRADTMFAARLIRI